MACLNNICTKWSVGNAVRSALLSDTDLVEMIGQKVYPIVAPEPKNGRKDIGDFVVYRRVKYNRIENKFGVSSDEVVLMITVVSEDYDRSVEIAELVDEALNSSSITSDNCGFSLSLKDSEEDFDDFKYVQNIYYTIK